MNGLGFVIAVTSTVFLSHQVSSVIGGDAGDFLSAIATRGIPHPPGYPLFSILGIIFSKFIQTGTLAYKAAFISSLSSILTSALLYLLIFRITGKALLAVIAVLTIIFAYPVFLYSVVVEVFALNNLFLVSVSYFAYLFRKEGKKRYLRAAVFLFSLSLTNHHISLFLIPGLLFLIRKRLKSLKTGDFLTGLILFVSGLTPYIYVFVSAKYNPAVNWMGSGKTENFLRLVFRSTYGTFTAGKFMGVEIWSRFLNILSLFEYFYKDITFWGAGFTLLGFIYLYLKSRKIFFYSAINILSFVFFLFYASFPIKDNFMLGTFERFMLPFYLFAGIPLSFGLVMTEKLISKFWQRIFTWEKTRGIVILNMSVFLVIPFSLLIRNSRRILILKNDATAENFANDILGSAGEQGMILLSSDTPLFNSQYVYYSGRSYRKIKLIHFSKLYLPFYIKQLNHEYPEIEVRDVLDTREKLEEFLAANGRNFSVFTNQSFNISKGRFIPWGLLYKFIPVDQEENSGEISAAIETLWRNYHDPLSGSLKDYHNLYLSDILRLYGIAHLETANYQATAEYYDLAVNHLKEAKKLIPDDPDSYFLLSQINMRTDDCQAAENELDQVLEKEPENPLALYLKYQNFKDCFKDGKKAEEFFDYFQKAKQKLEIPLEKL